MKEQNGEKIFDSAKKGEIVFFIREKRGGELVIEAGKVVWVSDENVGIETNGGGLNVRFHGEYSDSFDALIQLHNMTPVYITKADTIAAKEAKVISLADEFGYGATLQEILFKLGEQSGEGSE